MFILFYWNKFMFYGFTFLLAWNVYIIYKKLTDCLETLIFASVMEYFPQYF